MCGFLFTYSDNILRKECIDTACSYIQKRGPDKNQTLRFKNRDHAYCTATHFLLDVSGSSALQPIQILDQSGNLVYTVLFNGEIYNYSDLCPQAVSDTQALSLILSDGKPFDFSRIDGEYAIVVYDHASNLLTVATDQFMTKPVCVGWSSNHSFFGVASYPSALSSLGADQHAYATPNTVQVFKLSEPESWSLPPEKPTDQSSTIVYSLDQTSTTYNDWDRSFLLAVNKRASHGTLPIFVPLSSGYDSGAICLALNLLNIPYNTITIDSGEDENILKDRVSINSRPSGSCEMHLTLPSLSEKETSEIRKKIAQNCENFQFLHSSQSLLDDDGAIGAYRVAEVARELGWLVCLSGCGADEIISDYGFNGKKHYPHSEFGGLFPNDLHGFFPWKKFYADTMRSYLFKDELIFGVFGIEGRYPFLDPLLSQSFLSLTSSLKNLEYKAPLASFLRKHDYPFEEGIKRGFTPFSRQTRSKSLTLSFIDAAKSSLRKPRNMIYELFRKNGAT